MVVAAKKILHLEEELQKLKSEVLSREFIDEELRKQKQELTQAFEYFKQRLEQKLNEPRINFETLIKNYQSTLNEQNQTIHSQKEQLEKIERDYLERLNTLSDQINTRNQELEQIQQNYQDTLETQNRDWEETKQNNQQTIDMLIEEINTRNNDWQQIQLNYQNTLETQNQKVNEIQQKIDTQGQEIIQSRQFYQKNLVHATNLEQTNIQSKTAIQELEQIKLNYQRTLTTQTQEFKDKEAERIKKTNNLIDSLERTRDRAMELVNEFNKLYASGLTANLSIAFEKVKERYGPKETKDHLPKTQTLPKIKKKSKI